MNSSYDTMDPVSIMRTLHRLQERGASGRRQDSFLRAVGIEVDAPKTTTADDAKPQLSGWNNIPLPNVNKPVFLLAGTKELVVARCCPTCKKGVAPEKLDTEILRREYGISGLCAPCQKEIFDPPAVKEIKHHCAVGECVPLKEMSKANQACAECTESIMASAVQVGDINGIEGPHYQCYAGFSCSFHGKENIMFIDDCDKHETWGCGICGAEREFRVRKYDAYGDEL